MGGVIFDDLLVAALRKENLPQACGVDRFPVSHEDNGVETAVWFMLIDGLYFN